MTEIALTNSPVDIIAANSALDGDTIYTIQSESRLSSFVHVDDGDNEPAADRGRKVRPFETIRAKAGAGGKLWVWAPGTDSDFPISINVYKDV